MAARAGHEGGPEAEIVSARSRNAAFGIDENGSGADPQLPARGRITSYATSTSSELAKLADLHDRGVITDAEFEREKQKILH